MRQVLDVVALRSLVAVADCGGFHRAAGHLMITQSAVSQHVRRLERVVGRALVERQGRGAAFTPDGQALLGEARRILGAHDDALRRLVGAERPTVTVGTTEHAADVILPAVTSALPGHQVRFRIDRTRRLDEAVDRGVLDLAVHLAEASSAAGEPVGELPLIWYAAGGWHPPTAKGWPVVAIEEPCVLRRRALTALAARGLDPYVVCDSGYVAGVLDAVRSGLGVALMAAGAKVPDGVVARPDLPPVEPAAMILRTRNGADPSVAAPVTEAIRTVLDSPRSPGLAA